MNDQEQLEAELRQCSPLEPPDRLHRAIAAELGGTTVRRAVRRRWILWPLGSSAAACLILAAVLLWPSRISPPGDTGSPQPGLAPATSARLTPEQIRALPPTEWGYELAVQSSPEDRVMFQEHQADVLLPNVEKDGSSGPGAAGPIHGTISL